MSIKAKVAKIIDNRTVIINAGRIQGVKLDMKFLISSFSDGSSVIDPDSMSVLGNVTLPKVRVKVTRVDDSYAVCETYKYVTVNKGGSFAMTADDIRKLLEPQRFIREYETFEMEDPTDKKIDETKSKVHVGDLAESIDAQDES